MKQERIALVVAIVALAGLGWCANEIHGLRGQLTQVSRGLPSPVSSATNVGAASTNLEQRLRQLEATAPGLGETMSHIQLHFAKLYYAGEARNWDLARFERTELVERFDSVAALQREVHGVNLAGVIEAFKQTQLQSLKDAVEMKDRSLFREAYQEAIRMCNACHQSTLNPFIVITAPTNPPVANQRWAPPE